MKRSQWGCLVGVLGVALVLGCGHDPLGRRPLSGTVTLDGAPVQYGSIAFHPIEGGETSSGAMIQDGEYHIAREQGLPPGKYRVEIRASEPPPEELPAGHMPGEDLPPPPPELVPPEWNTKSDKTIEVTGDGSTEFNFEIKTQ